MQAVLSKTLSDFRDDLRFLIVSLCVAMIYNSNIATTIKEHCSDYRRARNFYASLLKRQSYSFYTSSFVFCILCKNLVYFGQKKLPAFHRCTVPLPLVKNCFSSPFKVLHILTTGRTLSFAFSKMQLHNFCVLTFSGRRKKRERP